MARSFTAQMRQFTEGTKANMDLILRASVQEVGEEMTKRAAGTSDGGVVKEGYVPVVTSELINSHQISINGGVILDGAPDYSGVVTGLEMGDTVRGVFTAPHARAKEYGFTTERGTQVPGWFFVRGAVQQWPAIVDRNARAFSR